MMVPIIPRFMGRTSFPALEVPACRGCKHLASRDRSEPSDPWSADVAQGSRRREPRQQDQEPANQKWDSGV